MSAHLPSQPAEVFARRQASLRDKLSGTPALVFAGSERARNYPANVYPYRADSHFLYLVGAAIPGAALWLGPGGIELFVPPEAEDDALWHGALPGFDDIGRATGVAAVRGVDELPATLGAAGGGDAIASVPSADPLTRAIQRELLGRDWPTTRAPSVADLGARDLSLVDALIARPSAPARTAPAPPPPPS